MGVIVAFLGVGTVGYAVFGFVSGSGVGFTAAVAFAGLLLGRRAMYATIVWCIVTVAVVGTLMVNDVIPLADLDQISLASAQAWVRSGVITFLLILIIGSAVTGVVERIEQTMHLVESESRQRRNAELRVIQAQSTELIAQLGASVAHDVNNQLTVIAAWSDRFAGAQSADERAAASLAIERAIGQAAALTRQMLMLGRRDAPAPETVVLSQFLRERQAMLDSVVHGHAELTVHADPDAACSIDPSQLSQVLLNLAVNARDAMPDGGLLAISARRLRDTSGVGVGGPISRGDWMVLSAQDSGSGMDAKTRRRVFEPFFTTKDVGDGSGLGLATVAAVVQEAAGHVGMDSEPGRGTRIEVWLPAVEPISPGPGAIAPSMQRLDGVRLLLAEDSAAVRDVARQALEDAGAAVVTAIDATEALARMAEEGFGVLCTDVVMPGPSVADVVAEFRRHNPEAAVLLCSGYVGDELVRHGVEEGEYPLIHKPYTPAAIVDAVITLRRS